MEYEIEIIESSNSGIMHVKVTNGEHQGREVLFTGVKIVNDDPLQFEYLKARWVDTGEEIGRGEL